MRDREIVRKIEGDGREKRKGKRQGEGERKMKDKKKKMTTYLCFYFTPVSTSPA